MIGNGFRNENANELILSTCTAFANGTAQFLRIYLESRAVEESFVEYALNCGLGRVRWVPFERKIINILSADNESGDNMASMNSGILLERSGSNDNYSIGSISPQSGDESVTMSAPNERPKEQIVSYRIKYDIPVISWFLRTFYSGL